MSVQRRKKGKKLFAAIAVMLILLVFLGGLYIFKGKNGTDHITRAFVARQTALALAGREEIESSEAGSFSEKDSDNWYVPYAEYLYSKEIWDKEKIPANRETMSSMITGQELLDMAENLKLKEEFALSEGNTAKMEAAKEDWNTLYGLILKTYDPEGAVKEAELLIIGTPNNLEAAGAWEAYTDKGIYSFEGLSLDSMVDKRILARVRDLEILEVKEVISDEVIYENVWLEECSEEGLKVYLYGTWRNFSAGNISGDCEKNVADLHLKGGKLSEVALKKETIQGKLQAVSETELEIEGYGKVPLSEAFHVYRTFGSFAELSKEELVVGYEQASYIVAEGKICAALIGESVSAENIRVLLTDASVGSIFHETAVLTSDRPFTVIWQNGKEQEQHGAGETVQFHKDSEYFKEGRIRIRTETGGKIGFTSFNRKYGAPWYEGEIELALTEEGILIINEVDLETYLCYVVPSEMPESYGLEALKAQAICARSYACRQIEGGAYSTYGAHVDDTTTFQVYNNTETDDLTKQAVEETAGQVLTYGGNLVTAYYYATSCGCGNDMQVWGSSQEKYPYLQRIHMAEGSNVDLSSEDAFRTYLENGEEGNLEYDAPWYRWETEMSVSKATERMDRFLAGYAKKHTEQVFFRQADGSFIQAGEGEEIKTIGSVTKITAEERSTSGYVNKLLIEGTEGAVRIERPGTVRALLGDTELTYTRKNGTTSTGKTILPSASIVLEEIREGETLTGWKIKGGGYGHGVGMSQTAASTLAAQGSSCAEILAYFYPGTEIMNQY